MRFACQEGRSRVGGSITVLAVTTYVIAASAVSMNDARKAFKSSGFLGNLTISVKDAPKDAAPTAVGWAFLPVCMASGRNAQPTKKRDARYQAGLSETFCQFLVQLACMDAAIQHLALVVDKDHGRKRNDP